MKLLILSIFLLIFPLLQICAAGDVNYKKNKINNKTVIYFNQKDLAAAESLNSSLPQILPYYESTFKFQMDQKLHIILSSSKNHQMMNGYSTQIPHNMTMYYGGGALDPDAFAALSWVDLLSTHEVAHDFQINSKNNNVSKYAHKFLGNYPAHLLAFIPIFPYPNLFLPQYILEGNAVLNECLFDNGGRLFSGAQRAIAFSYYKAGKFTPENMINTQLEFPFGSKPYTISGYFHAYLATKYGIEKVNSFFEVNSTKPLSVLALDDTYIKSFGLGYNDLFNDFLDYYKPLYQSMGELTGKKIAKDYFSRGMESDESNIYFFAQDLSGVPTLYTVDKTTQRVSKRSPGHLLGKPVSVKGKITTLSSRKTAYNKTTIGLFDSNAKILPITDGKSVQDFSRGEMLYFDVRSSYGEPQLYKDGKFISVAHSSAIFDRENNVYYFKNVKKRRTLYRNRHQIFSYDGYWGFPIDVIGGSVYFIAPTKSGSTLYKVENGRSTRLSMADNIVDARMINSQEFIAKSVSGESYHYILGSVQPISESPYTYQYSFENSSKSNLQNRKGLAAKSEEYNSLLNLKYYAATAQMYYQKASSSTANDSYFASINLLFEDPLRINSASLGYLQTDERKLVQFNYSNTRYRLQYMLSAIGVIEDDSSYFYRYADSSTGLGGRFLLKLPFWENSLEGLGMTLSGYADYDDAHKNPFILAASYTFNRSYGRAVNPTTAAHLSLYGKYDKGSYYEDRGEDLTILGGKLLLGKGFYNEFYIQLKGQYSKASSGNTIKINDSLGGSFDQSDFTLSSLEYNHFANQVYSGSLKLAQTFYIDWYHRWIPIGLRRETLFAEVESMELRYDGVSRYAIVSPWGYYLKPRNLVELRAGIDFDLLLFHNIPVTGRLFYVRNSNNGGINNVVFSAGAAF